MKRNQNQYERAALFMRITRRLLCICAPFAITSGLITASETPFPPRAGQPGSTAIAMDDPGITSWATSILSISWGANVDAVWQHPENILGPATGQADTGVVALGEGGSVILAFEPPISAGQGWDFAVFGNAFSDYFIELATVSVSSDGTNFITFPHTSLTTEPVGSFGLLDPRKIDGFAEKYRVGFGTPFDLASLPYDSAVDIHRITHVRIDDVPGDGSRVDSQGNPIYDPYPTVGSAGFDFDAVAVLDEIGLAFPGNINVGQGWRWKSPYGYLFTAVYPWIYSASAMDWLYHVPSTPGAHFLHSHSSGWLWTADSFFPYAYAMGEGRWLMLSSQP